jgi:hypothetical protein
MNQIVITNQGRVKRFDVPEGWVECEATRGAGDVDYLREFMPLGNPEVKLSFYYRGSRVDAVTGSEFLKILSSPEHELSDNERSQIQLVIRDAAEPSWFYIQSLRTDQINRMKVLVVEGTWLKNRLSNLGVFFDTDKSGMTIQEIHFMAPEKQYEAYLPEAIKAIKSIEWK